MLVTRLCLLALALSQAWAWQLDMSRLREKNIQLPTQPAQNKLGVPIVDPPNRTAGYFKLDRTSHDAHMFFFYFQARKAPATAPVVLWMTGGPGCSSELAVLYENGPYTLDSAGQQLTETEYGWDVTHHMIFVDQPIGTGFSYTTDDQDTVYNEKGVADDMLDFLQHFFAAHPDLAHRPFYITGESYAGHYVPAVSHRVWLSNTQKEGPYINLKGLAVGNGLTSPTIQYNAYGDYALDNNLIGKMTRAWMSFLYPVCKIANNWCDSTNWDFLCAIGMQYCMATQFAPVLSSNPGINVYDITKKCDGALCYDFTAADHFLNLPSTREALGVGDIEWQSCNYDVYGNFQGDWLHRYDTVLPDMMADGIRVMIYAGDLDLICNWLGNRRWVDALEWSGAEGWDAAPEQDWAVQGKAAGSVKTFGPLSFVRVYKAGHMVPMDQALNSLTMITTWTRNVTLTQLNKHQQSSLPALFNTITAPRTSVEEAGETNEEVPEPRMTVLEPGRQASQVHRFVSTINGLAGKAAAAARRAVGGLPYMARRLQTV